MPLHDTTMKCSTLFFELASAKHHETRIDLDNTYIALRFIVSKQHKKAKDSRGPVVFTENSFYLFTLGNHSFRQCLVWVFSLVLFFSFCHKSPIIFVCLVWGQ